jgi:hypothetical protein
MTPAQSAALADVISVLMDITYDLLRESGQQATQYRMNKLSLARTEILRITPTPAQPET